MTLYTYEVGQLYHPGVTKWPESTEYNFRAGGHELRLFLKSPTAEEVAAVEKGEVRLAFLVYEGVIFFLHHFSAAPGHSRGLPWSDCPYTWHLVTPESDRVLPEPLPTTQSRHLLSIVLVDAATGLVRALRVVSMSPAFTAELHDAIRQQSERPFDPAAHDLAIKRAYLRWPRTSAMVREALFQTKGGD